MSIKELETAISELSAEELARFAEWFDEYRAHDWDRQIEIDAVRLDALVREAEDDIAAGRVRPLP